MRQSRSRERLADPPVIREQNLEHMEKCNLCEVFPKNADSLEDFKRTMKFAYLYGKTVTLSKSHWPESNQVMLRNRRIGVSLTGVTQFIDQEGIETLRDWCDEGYETIQHYDDVYSDWLCIPKSIKTTTVKPSGTVSLLEGSTPGVHWPQRKHYIRRVRLNKDDDLVDAVKEAGYNVEPAVSDPDHTVVVEFPVKVKGDMRTEDQVSMWEKLHLASFMQRHWSDNGVSVTVTFDPETEGHEIEHALDYFQYHLKAVSFLPRAEEGAYDQMPYESISREKYDKMVEETEQIDFSRVTGHEAEGNHYCDSDKCEI